VLPHCTASSIRALIDVINQIESKNPHLWTANFQDEVRGILDEEPKSTRPVATTRCRAKSWSSVPRWASNTCIAQIGNASGNYIPNAPAIVASAGVTIGEKTGYFGTVRWRYLGASPLTEDNAFRSPATSIVNARVGYRWENGWSVHLDILNLLNTQANQITYAYGSIIKTDSLYNLCFVTQTAPAAVCQNGVMDYVLHPIEPLAVRLTLTGAF